MFNLTNKQTNKKRLDFTECRVTSILKDFIVVEKGIIICAQGMNVNKSPSGT